LIISVYSHEQGSFVAILDNISGRKKAEEALRFANEELEKRVEERTAELKAKTVNLEEVNTALRVLLDTRAEDRKELEEAIAGNLKSLILPYIEKLQRTQLSADQATYLSILQSHLLEIESRFIKKLSLQHMGLTPTEMQVAALIRDGKASKDIAGVLHVSEKAVEFHRNNLRRKLSIKNKKENLRSHLLALS
jgi:DNA-binding CsgD family transcriptional regulator